MSLSGTIEQHGKVCFYMNECVENFVSFVCPTNDCSIYEKWLHPSLKEQINQNFEIILIDTKNQRFASAAEALNYGAGKARGNVLVFCHHDVVLLSPRFVDDVIRLSNSETFGIAGVAGTELSGKPQVYSSVTQGPDHAQAGIRIERVVECGTLDERLFIIKKSNFSQFDILGNTWHFYAVDYSLKCHQSNQKVLLFPLPIYHVSPGYSLNGNYFDYVKVLAKKYPSLKTIRTTMGTFRNNAFLGVYLSLKKAKSVLFEKRFGHK